MLRWRLIGCVLRGAAFVVMMQTAHFTNLYHGTLRGGLYSSGLWCVFAERQVSSPPTVISAVRCECPMQRAFAEYDDMIPALAANGPDAPFDVGPLPSSSRCRQQLFDPHRLHFVMFFSYADNGKAKQTC